MQTNKGIAPLLIIAIIIVVAALGYGGYRVSKSDETPKCGPQKSPCEEVNDSDTSNSNADANADAGVGASADADVALGTSANLSFNTLGDAAKAGKNLKCTIALSGNLIFYISSDGKIRQETTSNGNLLMLGVYADGKVYAKNFMSDVGVQTVTGTQAKVMIDMLLGTSFQMFTCVETSPNPSLFILK